MEEIEVGEYVRLDDGTIGKVIPYDNGIKIRITEIDTWKPTIESIKKHSFNIIDLIEKDDVGIVNCYGLLVKKFITESDILELKLGNYELLKVVTKEQFAAVEYKLDN